MAISIYDMDRTITRGGTWGPWLKAWLADEAPARALWLPALGLAGLAYAARAISRGQLKALAHLAIMGRRTPRARVTARAAKFAANVVAQGCFPAALAQIAADRAEGRTLVLATASNQYYADAIGAALGFDAVIATPSSWVGDTLDWHLAGPNNYAEAKARAVEAWLAAHARPSEPLRFHSDHHSDAPVFQLIAARGGEAVPVNPTPPLRALADRHGWPCLEWGEVEHSLFERA